MSESGDNDSRKNDSQTDAAADVEGEGDNERTNPPAESSEALLSLSSEKALRLDAIGSQKLADALNSLSISSSSTNKSSAVVGMDSIGSQTSTTTDQTTPAPPSSPAHSSSSPGNKQDLEDLQLNEDQLLWSKTKEADEGVDDVGVDHDESCLLAAEEETDELKAFPIEALDRLNQMLARPRWVVPVLPGQELEILLESAVAHVRQGRLETEPGVLEFLQTGLTTSFLRLMNDTAVQDWKLDIQKYIYWCTDTLMSLSGAVLSTGSPVPSLAILNILVSVFNPNSKYHSVNSFRSPMVKAPPIKVLANSTNPIMQRRGSQTNNQQQMSPPEDPNHPESGRTTTGTILSNNNNSNNNNNNSNSSDHDPENQDHPENQDQLQQQEEKEDPDAAAAAIIQQQRQQPATEGEMILPQPTLPTYAIQTSRENSLGSKIWLCEFVDKFGQEGGFAAIKSKFATVQDISIGHALAYLKLGKETWERTLERLNQLRDEDLKDPKKLPASSPSSATSPGGSTTSSGGGGGGGGKENSKAAVQTSSSTTTTMNSSSNTVGDSTNSTTSGGGGSNQRILIASELAASIHQILIRVPDSLPLLKLCEQTRLKLLLRVLADSSFAGRMTALRDLSGALNQSANQSAMNRQEIAHFMIQQDVVGLALKSNLHHQQYVERVESIFRALLQAQAFTLEDLDKLWRAGEGKHEQIMTNVHNLLAKLAFDLNPNQLQHLFTHFSHSWKQADPRQRERLLRLIRGLAEDDRTGQMGDKVLELVWRLARDPSLTPDIVTAALNVHVGILKSFFMIRGDDTKLLVWMDRCVDELGCGRDPAENWVVPATRQLKEIASLFPTNEGPIVYHSSSYNANPNLKLRMDVVSSVQSNHSLVAKISANLAEYQQILRQTMSPEALAEKDPNEWGPYGGQYSHRTQIGERLRFLQFLLRDGALWLCDKQTYELWEELIVKPVFLPIDRVLGFQFFTELLAPNIDQDLDPEITHPFFVDYVLQFDPSSLDQSGMECFQRFFLVVNTNEYNLVPLKGGYPSLKSIELIGEDYLWRIILSASTDVARMAIDLFKGIYCNLNPAFHDQAQDLHTWIFEQAVNKLKGFFDTLELMTESQTEDGTGTPRGSRNIEMKMNRVLTTLRAYVVSYEKEFSGEKSLPPVYRCALGRLVQMTLRINPQQHSASHHQNNTAPIMGPIGNINAANNHNNSSTMAADSSDELMEMSLHSNMTIRQLKTAVRKEYPYSSKIELINSDDGTVLTNPKEEGRTLDDLGLANVSKPMLDVRALSPTRSSSPDSSSESSPIQSRLTTNNINNNPSNNQQSNNNNNWSQTHRRQPQLHNQEYDGTELCLPGSHLSKKTEFLQFLFKIGDLAGKIGNKQLVRQTNALLQTISASDRIEQELIALLTSNDDFVAGGVDGVVGVGGAAEVAVTPLEGATAGSSSLEMGSLAKFGGRLEAVFLDFGPTESAYYLAVLQGLLIPAKPNFDTPTIQAGFYRQNGLSVCLQMLANPKFMAEADVETRAGAYASLLSVTKFMLSVSVQLLTDEGRGDSSTKDLLGVPFLGPLVVSAGKAVAHYAREVFKDASLVGKWSHFDREAAVDSLFRMTWSMAKGNPTFLQSPSLQAFPNSPAEQSGASSDRLPPQTMTPQMMVDSDSLFEDTMKCFELVFIITEEGGSESEVDGGVGGGMLSKFSRGNPDWDSFIIDLVLAPNPFIRQVAGQSLAAELISMDPRAFFNPLLSVRFSRAEERPEHSGVLFNILSLILVNWRRHDSGLRFRKEKKGNEQRKEVVEPLTSDHVLRLLQEEFQWISKAKAYTVDQLESYPDDQLLEGHILLTKDLLPFLTPTQKTTFNMDSHIMKDLLYSFLFASSRGPGDVPSTSEIQRSQTHSTQLSTSSIPTSVSQTSMKPIPRSETTVGRSLDGGCVSVCGTNRSTAAAFALLSAVATGSCQNLRYLCDNVTRIFYADTTINRRYLEWDFAPAVDVRGSNPYVGLKNAGATCYMNSILQQLFMIEPLRVGLLNIDYGQQFADSDTEEHQAMREVDNNNKKDPKEYYLGILNSMQRIFANLLGSQLQYYTPKRLWKTFRFGINLGTINVREQQDAVEFYNSIVDALDEAAGALKPHQPTVVKLATSLFGGSFADQKICKTCPHRYEMESSFTSISVDIRNRSTLTESLEEYVKGDLLESDNQYYCEKCERKVDAIKRLCIKKLPSHLWIQLKRFDYDFERESSVKFNHYFQFPRRLNMEPYTANGLAKREGEHVIGEDGEEDGEDGTEYMLRGVVVHSGVHASSGHYYSYIFVQNSSGNQQQSLSTTENTSTSCFSEGGMVPEGKWYKFDDTDVSETKFDDEEMRNNCFGGDCNNDSDNNHGGGGKSGGVRFGGRRGKRWWNAYILIYEKINTTLNPQSSTTSTTTETHQAKMAKELSTMSLSSRLRQMPPQLENIVREKNMRLMHERNQYTPEFFAFCGDAARENIDFIRKHPDNPENEKLALTSLSFFSQFLFATGLRAKKSLRRCKEWVKQMDQLLSYSPACRYWFMKNVLFINSCSNFQEYLLESPINEVRETFKRILVNLTCAGMDDLVRKSEVDHWRSVRRSQMTGPGAMSDQQQQQQLPGGRQLRRKFKDQNDKNEEEEEEEDEKKEEEEEEEDESFSISQLIIRYMLYLLRHQGNQTGRVFNQLFGFFKSFAEQGYRERALLYELNVEEELGGIVVDEMPMRTHINEQTDAFFTLAVLVRSSQLPQSRLAPTATLNPYIISDEHLPLLPESLERRIFDDDKLIRKYIDWIPHDDETRLLLKFLAWENIEISKSLYKTITYQLGVTYSNDFRPFMKLLHDQMTLNDSIARQRLEYILKGCDSESVGGAGASSSGGGGGGGGNGTPGILSLLQKERSLNEKKVYILMKIMSQLFESNPIASTIFQDSAQLRQLWFSASQWLNNTLQRATRNPYYSAFNDGGGWGANSGGSHNNNNNNNINNNLASHHQQQQASNENNSQHLHHGGGSTMLERTNSAMDTLTLCHDIYRKYSSSDPADEDVVDGGGGGGGESLVGGGVGGQGADFDHNPISSPSTTTTIMTSQKNVVVPMNNSNNSNSNLPVVVPGPTSIIQQQQPIVVPPQQSSSTRGTKKGGRDEGDPEDMMGMTSTVVCNEGDGGDDGDIGETDGDGVDQWYQDAQIGSVPANQQFPSPSQPPPSYTAVMDQSLSPSSSLAPMTPHSPQRKGMKSTKSISMGLSSSAGHAHPHDPAP